MTFRTLIRRSLRYHWRAHLGVVLGAAAGSAALIGALVVGDSVKGSLRERVLQRLGNVDWAMNTGDRFVTEQLTTRWQVARKTNREPPGGEMVGLLHLPGTAARADGASRANHAQIIGVDNSFHGIGGGPAFTNLSGDSLVLNRALASQLHAKQGDRVIVRVYKPSALSLEAAVSPRSSSQVALPLTVTAIVDAEGLGDFSLRAEQSPPMNAFVALAMLQQALGLTNRVNEVLAGLMPEGAVTSVKVTDARGLTLVFYVAGRFLGWTNLFAAEDGFRKYVRVSGNVLLNSGLGIGSAWRLEDAGLELKASADFQSLELRSRRAFLDAAVANAVERPIDWVQFAIRDGLGMMWLFTNQPLQALWDQQLGTNAQPLLTYLANLLRAGTNTTPYSMVTAAGPPWTPPEMRDDEVLVSQWLADDLQVKPGDEIVLSYFDPESGARLVERTNTFRVRGIVPTEMPWADRTLMPDFPGIEKAESTSDWDAGFPLIYKIRQKDEDYWKQHRGTPKAFVTLAAGQKMWANRFGNLTAIRFPVPTNATGAAVDFGARGQVERDPALASRGAPPQTESAQSPETAPQEAKAPSPLRSAGALQSAEEYRAVLEKKILANLKPEEVGLRFEPVREQALQAAEQSQDFGGLFLGFSFFLIAAALLLMALLFQLGLEQRAPEIGTFLALGFTSKQVRRMLIWESAALSLIGGVLGALGGLGYARAMLHGLATIWRDAVGASALSFHATPQTLVVGVCASTAVCIVTIWLSLRRFVRRPATELLAGEVQGLESEVRSPKSKVVAVGAFMAAVGLAGLTVARGDTANAGAFFGAGALVLVAELGFVSAWLRGRTGVSPVAGSGEFADGSRRHACPTLASLAVRGCARRRKRSLSTMAMLACGSFLIVSIGVFRLDANRDATQRSSGTGGFALIGETTLPVVHDLNSPSGRDFFALSDGDLKDVSCVPLRVREGDEASCLNLNRAQKPRLLGMKPELLEGRFAFAKGSGWAALKSEVRSSKSENEKRPVTSAATNEVAAIGDANSIRWSMGKKVGDTIDYVDERGQPFKVRIVGAVVNSILQGQLIIDEAEFVKRFPNESGYRQFLIDVPTNRVTEVSATLSRALQDVGLELTPAARRLAQFNAVQNTYLGTFQVLGGLGLLLGSVGLGIVVLRNVLERRGELAVLLAVGFRARMLQRLLLVEHGALLGLGLSIGLVSAAVAVLPSLLSPGTQLPYGSLAWTLAGVLLNGVVWTWLATHVALRGNLLEALRNE